MAAEDANDVTKALAAFGAPTIQYHSFTQGQIKPSSVVQPRRRPDLPPALPGPAAVPPLIRAPEVPVAAYARPNPGFLSQPPQPAPANPPQGPMPPVPAFRRTIDPAAVPPRPAAALRPAPSVAAVGSLASGPMEASALVQAARSPAAAVQPVPGYGRPALIAGGPPAILASYGAAGSRSVAPPHSLAEIFALLASDPTEANKPD